MDADALTLLARDRSLVRRAAPTLLTPHAGELSRLLGVPRHLVEGRRVEHVRRAADELGATVLLQGSTTVIAETGRPIRVNGTGSPWLATGGTGDVLSGLAGALMAGGLSCYDAAACAAHLHGMAGGLAAAGPDRGPAAPISAGDLPDALKQAIRSVKLGE
jgi:hydroxyethylthiazole kinase-like uncharacterized protein yjeF